MKQAQEKVEQQFWAVFKRVLGVEPRTKTVAKDEIESWDSLRHVELVFEIEETFGLDVAPQDIVDLYSNTDVILEYIQRRLKVAD